MASKWKTPKYNLESIMSDRLKGTAWHMLPTPLSSNKMALSVACEARIREVPGSNLGPANLIWVCLVVSLFGNN